MSVRERIEAFCEKYPQTAFGRDHVVFNPLSLTDHNIDGTLRGLSARREGYLRAEKNGLHTFWSEEELTDTESLLRELRVIPEAERLAQLSS